MKIPKPTDADKERFQDLAPDAAGVELKPMFGNLGAFVNGNMFMGLFGSDIGVKLPDDQLEKLLTQTWFGTIRTRRTPDGWLRHTADGLVEAEIDTVDRRSARPRGCPATQGTKEAIREEGDQEGQQIDEEAIMTVDVQTEIVIDRPLETVASYAADPSNAPEWYANIDSVEWKTTPPVAIGSSMSFVARFLGRRLEYTYKIIDLVPGERLVMRTQQGPFPMETTYEWAAVDGDSTRMSLRNRGEPSGFARLTAAAMQRAMRRANTKDLQNIKRILEAPDTNEGGRPESSKIG